MYFKVSQVEFSNLHMYYVLLSLKDVLNLANSADPDEMQHYAAFHLGLHCLPKDPFRDFRYTKYKVEGWCFISCLIYSMSIIILYIMMEDNLSHVFFIEYVLDFRNSCVNDTHVLV